MMKPDYHYWVIHPLDDVPEIKRSTNLPIRMTPFVKGALLALRIYLILMVLLVGYSFIHSHVKSPPGLTMEPTKLTFSPHF